MSQHTFETQYNGKNIELLMGWDKPLQQYFMVIEYSEDETPPDDNPEGIVYSNLLDEDLAKLPDGDRNLEYFKSVTMNLGIKVPDSMWVETEKDRINNEGNKKVHHN